MIDKVETLTVADAIVEKILGYISTGKLAWGEQLPAQRELAKMLDVGVSSAREALQVLQAMGFVEVRRGAGTYVAERPSVPLGKSILRTMYQDSDVQDLMELREVLDTGLAVLAAKKASESDIGKMDACLKDLEAYSELEPEKAAESDLRFHIAMAESVRNPLLTQFSTAVRESYAKFLGEIPHSREGTNLHRKVLDSVVARNPLGARDAIIELLKHTRNIYLKEHSKRGNDEKGAD
ncbi:MAG: FadR/GntR family transcriptional regulator [Rectinemataceae bacterium]|nr:FadR/GntR family transcriptional regulator [Rectinemataceae bacterium]